MRLPVLYPITDRALAGGRDHAEIVRLLIEGGASLVQVREKSLPDREFAIAVRGCVAVRGARILVNDRPDVAKVCGAAGVHVGNDGGALDLLSILQDHAGGLAPSHPRRSATRPQRRRTVRCSGRRPSVTARTTPVATMASHQESAISMAR